MQSTTILQKLSVLQVVQFLGDRTLIHQPLESRTIHRFPRALSEFFPTRDLT
ncbi:MAG: hypothetical protein MUF49_25715 [Oculatellaceae cyanobacterium Prado106]|nr:hypothetical protein [Oculatellaceae cyanobacterium Prado106]